MRTSYSALETYKLCPQKYKFQELDRIPAKKSKAALFGTRIHEALRFMFSQDPLFPTLAEVLDKFRQTWREEATELDSQESELYRADGERLLKNFYVKNAPWNFSVIDLESRFEVLIDDPRHGETHVLAGRIDRIDRIDAGYEVIDYKTTRRMPSQETVDRDLQMSIYALGLQRRWPHVKPEEITLSLYFLKHGEKLSTARTAEATARTVDEITKTLSHIGQKLSSGERFEPTPGPHCDFCPYKPICPAWRHLYAKQDMVPADAAEIDALLKDYFHVLKEQRNADGRIGDIKKRINSYMEAGGFDRVFGDDGFISRSLQKRYAYDFEKIRAILEPLGKWGEILAADEKKLKVVIAGLPPETRSQIEDAKVLTKEFSVLTASSKKIPHPTGLRREMKTEG